MGTSEAKNNDNESRSLQEKLEHYRFCLEASSQLPWVADAEGNLIDVFEPILELTGVSRSAVLGQNWIDLVHPDDLPRVLSAWGHALETGDVHDVEMRLCDGAGNFRWMRSRAIPRRDEHGKILRWYGNIEDVDARHQNEERLKSLVEERTHALGLSEARFRGFVEQAAVGVLHADLQGNCVYVNSRFCEIVGRSAEEINGNRFKDYTHPEDVPRNAELLNRLRADGTPFTIEKRYVRPDGSLVWVSNFVSRIESQVGEPLIVQVICVDITDRILAEEARRKEEERYRFLADSIPMPVWTADLDGKPTYVNAMWSDYYGYRIDELEGFSWTDHIHPDDFGRLAEAWTPSLQSATPFEVDARLRHRSGEFRWHRCVGRPETIQDKLLGWVGVNLDIDDQLKKTRALELTSEFGRRLDADLDLERIVQVLCDVATEGSGAQFGAFFYRGTSAQGEPLTLYAISGASKEDYAHFGTPHQTPLFNAIVQGEGIVTLGDVTADPRFGTTGPYHGFPPGHVPVRSYMAVPVSLRNGEVFGALFLGHPEPNVFGPSHEALVTSFCSHAAVAIDNARLHQRVAGAYSELAKLASVAGTAHDVRTIFRALAEFVSEFTDASGLFVAEFDAETKTRKCVYSWSYGVEDDVSELPRLPLSDSPGSRAVRDKKTILVSNARHDFGLDDELHRNTPSARDAKSALVAPLLIHGEAIGKLEVFSQRPDAFSASDLHVIELATTIASISFFNSQLVHEERALRQMAEEAKDVLELRVEERTRALAAAKAEAEAANLAKSEFLSRTSHELRTPLNAILGFGQVLDRSELDSLQRESVGHILKGGRLLLDLINEVLDIARIESGRLDLSMEPVRLEVPVIETCSLIVPLAEQRRITVRVDSESLSGAMVRADLQRLKQIVLNLLSNAVKYNREGGSIDVSARPSATGHVELRIRDTGMGIAELDMPKLFEPFERLGAVDSHVEGTGLGLALSKRLAQAMNGDLSVTSTFGEGSEFTLKLLASDDVSAEPTEARVPPLNTPFAEVAPRTILCIEDNVSNLRLVEVVLQSIPGVQLISAIQGSLGLELAREHRPDAILLDLNLPDLPGRDVLIRLRASKQTRDIPVVVISADATEGQIERLLALGAEAYLTKPLDVAEFMTTLERILRRKANS